MQEALVEIRRVWQVQNKPRINIRIGINTGEMVVGNMGGARKFDYTVIGDSVNLASRLEGANKQYHTGILVSERTYEFVKDQILGRELDLIIVKGRSAPLRIFELLQMNNSVAEQSMAEFLSLYGDGLGLYRERRWDDAKAAFKQALRCKPDDYPSQLYIERAIHYAVSPPPAAWDGVFVMQTK
jgi:adenylate cyclase